MPQGPPSLRLFTLAFQVDRDDGFRAGIVADVGGRSPERLLEDVAQGADAQAMLHGKSVRVACVLSADVPRRFGFVQRPAPRAGEPEC